MAHEIASEVARTVEQTIGQAADVTVHVEPALPEHLRVTRGYRVWTE
jgi:divalent metal cation (Fe/Co/Zn/Cd) transporter